MDREKKIGNRTETERTDAGRALTDEEAEQAAGGAEKKLQQCLLCGYRTTDSDQFLEHIRNCAR